jgi:hypothetical protein
MKFSTEHRGANLRLESLSLNKPRERHIFLKIPDSASNLYTPYHNLFPFQKKKNLFTFFSLYGLGPLACSNSELISESMILIDNS